MVVRIPMGGGIGAVEHHSESNEAYFAHTLGLKVVFCSNPTDAYWMIQQAIETDDPEWRLALRDEGICFPAWRDLEAVSAVLVWGG